MSVRSRTCKNSPAVCLSCAAHTKQHENRSKQEPTGINRVDEPEGICVGTFIALSKTLRMDDFDWQAADDGPSLEEIERPWNPAVQYKSGMDLADRRCASVLRRISPSEPRHTWVADCVQNWSV